MKKFEVKNLENYFEDTILRRGYDYYKKGCIIKASYFDSNVVHTKVSGTVIYDCLIKMIDNKTFEMECNCPYDGPCKHLAASLFYIKNHELEESVPLTKNITLDDYKTYELTVKKDLNRLLYQYGGFFDWKHGDVFVDFIYEKAKELEENLEDKNLVQKIIFLYKLVDEAEYVDGSGGEHESAQYHINIVLDKLLSYDIDKLIHVIKEIGKVNFSYGLTDKNNIINSLGDDDSVPVNIKVDDYIEKLIDLNQEYRSCKLYLKIAKLIGEFQSLEQSLDFCEKIIKEEYVPTNSYANYHYQELIDYYVNSLEKTKQYDRLLEILDYLISLIHNTSSRYHSTSKYYEKYLMILKKLKRSQDYQNKLLEFYKRYPDLDKFIELKKLFHLDNNSNLYQELLVDAKKYGDDKYASVCIHENLLSDAFQAVKNNIFVLTKYGKNLENVYRDEMIEIYITYYKNLADNAYGRKAYQNVIKSFQMIQDLTLKNDVYSEIIPYIQENFKSKPAFQEELDFFLDVYL